MTANARVVNTSLVLFTITLMLLLPGASAQAQNLPGPFQNGSHFTVLSNNSSGPQLP